MQHWVDIMINIFTFWLDNIASTLLCNNIVLIYGFQPKDNDDENKDCVLSPKLASYVQEPEHRCCFILAPVFPWTLQNFHLQLNGQLLGLIVCLWDFTFVDLFVERIGADQVVTCLVCRDVQITLNAGVFICKGHKDGALQVYSCENTATNVPLVIKKGHLTI